jgi:hypothetical protein
MKRVYLVVLAVLLSTVAAAPSHAATLKMPAAPALDLGEVGPREIPVNLRLSNELRTAEFVVKTSPFDKISYPIGAYTVALLEKNLDRVFADGTVTRDGDHATDGAMILEVEIVSFDAVIPHPAYKPYSASVVYKTTVTSPSGDVIMTLTTTGSGQTSKGMMSGFKAKSLAAESAARAMNDAMTQLLQGLLNAEELSVRDDSESSQAEAAEPPAS